MLNVLNVKAADGYGAEFRKEAGETRIERIGHALERARRHYHEQAHGDKTVCTGCDATYLWADLEDIDGRLQEIARNIPVCTTPGLCEKHAS